LRPFLKKIVIMFVKIETNKKTLPQKTEFGIILFYFESSLVKQERPSHFFISP
jgi:hypothetical protein